MHAKATAVRPLCNLLAASERSWSIRGVMTAASIGAAKAGGYARYLESKTVVPDRGDYYLSPDGEPTQAPSHWLPPSAAATGGAPRPPPGGSPRPTRSRGWGSRAVASGARTSSYSWRGGILEV